MPEISLIHAVASFLAFTAYVAVGHLTHRLVDGKSGFEYASLSSRLGYAFLWPLVLVVCVICIAGMLITGIIEFVVLLVTGEIFEVYKELSGSSPAKTG